MGKLSDIVFKASLTKEFDVMGHKVVLRSLTTKDTIELNLEDKSDFKTKDLLEFALKILSKAIVSIDGIVPDNGEEVIKYLETQDAEVVLNLLSKYQDISNVSETEIKN